MSQALVHCNDTTKKDETDIYIFKNVKVDIFHGKEKQLNRCFVLQNFRIAKKSGNIFSAYFQYAENHMRGKLRGFRSTSGYLGSVRCLAIIRRFIL